VLILLALLTGLFAGLPSWAGTIARVSVSDRAITLRFDGRVAKASALLLPAADDEGRVTADRPSLQHGGASVALDLARPAIFADGRVGPDGRGLTLSLRRAHEADFVPPAAGGRMTLAASAAAQTMAVPLRVRSLPLPPIAGPAGRPLVVIDAGHGGHDPGALSDDGTLREKDVTLQAAVAVRDRLLAGGRVRVALTRSDDRFLVLQERFGIARRLGADLFISLHCDSAGNPLATGATAYTLSEVASDKEAARLAARENKADIIAGIDLGQSDATISSILIDLAQRETMTASAGFARLLGREAQPLIRTRPLFHRMASLVVLKAPDLPSTLLEMGYLSNAEDAAFLRSREGRGKVAESIRRAVELHFARRLLDREQTASGGAGQKASGAGRSL
jgi:N-acetylmuramoyl-L-alanine amidase